MNLLFNNQYMLRPHKFISEKNGLFDKIANFMGKNDILSVVPVQK